MIFYFAGRFEDQQELKGLALLAEQTGHTIASSWLDESPVDVFTDKARCRVAERDLADLQISDVFVLYSHLREPLPTRQAHSTELGYALALRQLKGILGVQIVGTLTQNVFHHLPTIQHFPDWDVWKAHWGIQ